VDNSQAPFFKKLLTGKFQKIVLYSKGRLKPPLTPLTDETDAQWLTPLTDGTDAQWPPTVGLPLSASTWELAREVEASPVSGRAVVKGQEESNFPSLRTR